METEFKVEVIPPSFVVTSAYAGTVVYGPGGKYGPRIQSDLQLVLVHSGSMIVEIDGVAHSVPPESIALLKPGHEEQFHFNEKRDTWHRWIAVAVEPLLPDAAAYFESLPLYIPLTARLNQLTNMLMSLQNDGCTPGEEVVKTLGRSAIWLYVKEHLQLGLNHLKHPAVLLAVETIHEKFGEDLSLSDLSQITGKTPEHLIRLFQRDEAVTPIQYLWQYRVKKGLELLRSTGLNIGEIAEQSGFKTSYHFARTIKRHTGLTPSEIRKEHYNKPFRSELKNR
ncbi:AraC family transcriptional regulator [Paenibacillus aceris]|uniref:AraC family transcriptional regulator of arabinose operon n=1 Tax=Paenibacillus aceris TaxID=869555 RepID=A0ABS4I1A5_9BACL|nr:AraC family transcriptional regulator [Paenibacillus aceris]MBP1964206.1 AraC family transcriptional regulator of arabinose operon [Paenibacillus aceris]NHW36532.1 helix-turn-helix transcriptional regulator [Paenibacillus aceris]